jgi:hypothetical protein
MPDARTAACPSCGAPLRFRGATSIVAVCAFCKATLVREGASLENIGRQADLLEDESPLRIGADGRHKGVGFTVVGRIQYRYGAGLWNEWHVLMADGKSAWLSDASREYTITYLVPPVKVPAFADLQPGQQVAIGKAAFTAMNMESADVVAGEGELPFRFMSGWKAPVADLRGEGNAFATIDYSEDPPHVYVGEKLPFDEFHFSGLRDPGHIGFVKGRALTFKCGGCGAPVESHLTTSEVVACGSCGTLTDVTRGVGEVVQKVEKHKKKFKPTIALGTTGTWRNVKYEFVGLMRRGIVVDGERYEWVEYLLHNVERGYAWVSEYQGHFSFIQNAAEVPKAASLAVGKPRVRYLGRQFTHFQRSEPKVSYLAGEFYWQVRYGDKCEANDYVAPPLILSSEKTGNELTWSLGEYVPGPELWKAFKLPGKPPHPVGVAPNQPSPHEGKALRYWLAFAAFVVAGLVVQVAVRALNFATKPTPVAFEAKPAARTQAVSPVFDLRGFLDGPVTVRTQSNVRDTWLALDLKLTEADTGRAYGLKRQLGYQMVAGTQDGSQDDVGEFSSVPPGRYTLTVEASAGASPTQYPPPTYKGTVEVYRSAPSWASFWMLASFLILWPIAAWSRASSFETERWSESDYAADSSDDDDD